MFVSARFWPALAVAVLAAAGFVGVYVVAIGDPSGQQIDHQLMVHFSALFGIDAPTEGAFGRWQLPLFASVAAFVAVIVAARRSAGDAVGAAASLTLTVGGAYLLKTLLPRPSFDVGPLHNSFPSNSVAVAAILVLILVGVAPRWMHGIALILGWTVGGGVSLAVIALQWHRPADVIGAWLLAIFAVAAVRVARSGWSWTSAVEHDAADRERIGS